MMIELPQTSTADTEKRSLVNDSANTSTSDGISTNAIRSEYQATNSLLERKAQQARQRWMVVGMVFLIGILAIMTLGGTSKDNENNSGDNSYNPVENHPTVTSTNPQINPTDTPLQEEEPNIEREPIPIEDEVDNNNAESTTTSMMSEPTTTSPGQQEESKTDNNSSPTVSVETVTSEEKDQLYHHETTKDVSGTDNSLIPSSTTTSSSSNSNNGGVWIYDENKDTENQASPNLSLEEEEKEEEEEEEDKIEQEEEEENAETSQGGYWFEDDGKSTPEETTQLPPSPAPDNDNAEDDESEADDMEDLTGIMQEGKEEDEASNAETNYPTGTIPYQYRRRGIPLTAQEKIDLAETWGQWTFVDSKKSQRPQDDYCAAYPHRDIPWNEFPTNAWQTDPDYLEGFLSQSKALVERAMEVHLAEYGFGPNDLPEEDFYTRRDKSPFKLEFVDNNEMRRRLSLGVNEYAGSTTQKSFDGLVRRLLHAVVSRDTFNLVMGGHSAAAGHGNHFQQSYTLQFQRVMEPVFARLGVKHFSRNIGMGGLGTIQNAMGAKSIYGRDVDILIWDSGMTENSLSPDFDLFARQGLLGSDRAPVLWSGVDDNGVYPALQEHADVDYLMYGSGLGPIPAIRDPTKVDEIPWAARYLKCDTDWLKLCKDNRYNGTCWIERPDHFVPPTPQKDEPGGRASWHDGNREHQLYGRTMSFTVLRALHEAIDLWDKQPGKVLKDDMWHVSAYYENIKSKVANLDPEVGTCYGIEDRLPIDFCTTPFQARTEFTPRAYPEHTSLRSIMKPFGPNEMLPHPNLNVYDPPDVYNPTLGVPKGEVDYLAIIENGNDFWTLDAPAPPLESAGSSNRLIELTVDDEGNDIVPGLGWGVNTKSSPQFCNGTYDSFCGRSEKQECLLYGHNDFRGGLTFDSLSGWGIFTLRNLTKGMIFVKMDSWRKAKDNPVTENWTSVNNKPGERSLTKRGNIRRTLKDDPNAHFCPDLLLEFAYGDTIVRIPADEILGERHSLVQRVVQVWTVMNDPGFTQGESVDVELGIRLRGCGRDHVFWVTHVYWA